MENDTISQYLLELLSTCQDQLNIYQHYCSHLKLFEDISKKEQPSKDVYKLLHNSFISFIHESLNIIPLRISELLDSRSVYPDTLFKTYLLLLDCLYIVINEVQPKYLVHRHQVTLMHCYVKWDRYDLCQELGLSILGSIDQHLLGGGTQRSSDDMQAIVLLNVDIIIIFADSLRLSKCMVIDNYKHLILLVERFQHWIRFCDDREKEKILRRHFVLFLTECGANFIRENLQEANEALAIKCCAATLLENGELFTSCGVEDSELDKMICTPLLSKPTCSFLAKLLDHLVINSIKGEPEEVQDIGVLDDVSSLRISLERLRTLKKWKSLSPTIHQAIEEHVSKIHLEKIWSKQDTNFKKSRDLVERAKETRKQGFDGLAKCIEHLDAAIVGMGDLSSKNTNARGPAYHVVAQAFCLKAFCIQEKEPNSKVFLEDIAKAKELWCMQEHYQFAEQNPLVSHYTFKLLHRVCGLLLNEEDIKDRHSDLYELMIKYSLWSGYSSEECMIMLWQSKSLSHSFCSSPINDVFLKAFSNHCATYGSLKYWTDCFATSKPTDIGFWINMSIISAVPSQDYNDDEAGEQARLYADEIVKGPLSAKSAYLVANLIYDVAERLLAKGLITKAYFYSSMAGNMRAGLWDNCFVYHHEKSIFITNPTPAAKAWSYDHDDFIVNPYVILRCRLESLLQEGNILEILGEGDECMKYFEWGKYMSSLLGLPNFKARFSAALAKVCRKKQLWQEAGLELDNLNNASKLIACVKCKSSLKAILDQEAFDLIRQKMNKTAENMLFEEGTTHESAANKLWKSCADKGKIDCAAKCGCKVRFGSKEAYCWHCKPVEDIKPTSLRTTIGKKWEWTQRCYRLKVLIGIAKCLVIKNEIEKAHELFLECICLLISMSTLFRKSSCCISLSFLFGYIEKNAVQDGKKNFIEDVLVTEVASLAYAISWFSLKSYTGVRFESHIPMTRLVSVLKYLFVVSREVPELFRKISRLLSIIYTLPGTYEDVLLMPSSNDAPSQSEWASFFHQASLGTNLNYTYQLQMVKMRTVPNQSSSSFSSLPKVAPESVMGLERFVREFSQGLGPAPILGISLLENGYCGLLRSLLPDGGGPPPLAWLMVSRFTSSCKPVVLLKPIHSIAGSSVDKSTLIDGSPWICPWGNTVVDKVAPVMRLIVHNQVRHREQQQSWVKELVNDMENKWFGEWKFLLLGQSMSVSGCYIGGKDPIPSSAPRIPSKYGRKFVARLPLILVIDMGIQMLPWESMEIVNWEDMYRMPSFSFILYTYAKFPTVPDIDPRDSYYRIGFDNESSCATNLEKSLKNRHHLKGKKSKDPNNIDELFKALSSTNLFFYYGHKDGSNYIFRDHVKNLPKCPAVILMACCSGVLDLSGSYMAHGPPLNYLFAGSPVVVANLWNVKDSEASKYCELLFDALLSPQASNKTIGSVIGDLRNKCSSKYMGAATVCYGVPTKISNKSP